MADSTEKDSIITARAALRALETTTQAWPTREIEYLVSRIEAGVNASGGDFAALDIKGKAGEEEMEKKVEAAEVRAHLVSARGSYSSLLKATRDTDYLDLEFHLKQMNEHLSLANKAPLTALDPTGKTPKEVYDVVLGTFKARGHLTAAVEGFEMFEKNTNNYGPLDVDFAVGLFLNALKGSGKSLSALDRTGKSTDEQIEQRIGEAKKQSHINSAREKFKLLGQWSGRSKDTCESLVVRIHEHFNKAGVDASVLDPEGKKSAQRMETRIQACLARNAR